MRREHAGRKGGERRRPARAGAILAMAALASSRVGGATLDVPAKFATIQAAIDVAQPGDVVLVQAGRYAGRLRLKPGVTLRSAGDDAPGRLGLKRAEETVIDGGGARADPPGVAMAEGATIDGFTVTGMGPYDEELWKKHHATRGEEQPHDAIGQFGSPAVGIVGVDCTVIHNLVHHNGGTGIGVHGGEERHGSARVARNASYRNMGGGIGSMAGSSPLIEGNTCFQNFYAGIGHDDASPLVTGNDCFENIRAGIGVSHGAAPVIRGNKCHGNRRAGIGVRGAGTSPVIEGNECLENGMAGIGCRDGAAPVIRGNRCERNALAGIGAQGGARPLIVGNECRENRLGGIGSDSAERVVIVDNLCERNDKAGIGLAGSSDAVVCFNRCVENGAVAIGLPEGGTAVIHGNQLARSGGMPPLVAILGQAKAILSQNVLSGGGVAAILVQGTAAILENRFQSREPKQGKAIWVREGSTASVAGNSFDGYRLAVDAAGSRVTILDNEARGSDPKAFVVRKPSAPAHVVGNAVLSESPGTEPPVEVEEPPVEVEEPPVEVEEPRGAVEGNVIKPMGGPIGETRKGRSQGS